MKTTPQQLEALAKIMRGVGDTFGPRTEVHQIELFCLAAAQALRDDPLDSGELAEKLGLSTSAVSRNIQWFAERGRMQKPGLRLINPTIDPRDYRRKPLGLTPKGKKWSLALAKLLGD